MKSNVLCREEQPLMTINISTIEFSELVEDIYSAALTTDWSSALNRIMEITHSNKAFFFLENVTDNELVFMEFYTTFDYSSQVLLDYKSRTLEDPFYQVTKIVPEGGFVYCNEHIDINEISNTEYYKNIFVPLKSHFALAGVMCRDSKYESALAITRGSEQLAYNKEDCNFFGLLVPHLSKAIHIQKELSIHRNYGKLTKSIMDQDSKAILVCDSNGNILLKNKTADEELTTTHSLELTNKKLILKEEILQLQLNYYINECANLSYNNISMQESIIIEDKLGIGPNILIVISPIVRNNDFVDISLPCCLITITFQKLLNWKNICESYNLTPKELELLQALYSKKKLIALTCELNVSYNTLKNHLQSIFRKLEVNSQAELLIKISIYNN